MNVAATVYRGEAIENTHIAHVAVVDAEGRLLYAFGDPVAHDAGALGGEARASARGAGNRRAGALRLRRRRSRADVRLAQQRGTAHRARARRCSRKRTPAKPTCAAAAIRPLSDAVYRTWIKRDFTPGAVCSNCSGKHAGMLAGAQAIGAAVAGLSPPRSSAAGAREAHGRRRSAICRTMACNGPSTAAICRRPLSRWTVSRGSMQKLAERRATPPETTRRRDSAALARIYRAMTDVSGTGRGRRTVLYCVDARFEGALVAKVGADASYAIGVRPSGQTARLGAKARSASR